MGVDAVYVAYWSLRDPLCQSQSLPVVRALAARGYRMALMTFEQPAWSLPPAERDRERNVLAPQGITWLPLRYHKRPAGASTVLDILNGARLGLRLRSTQGARLFHGRGTVAAGVAYLASRLGRTLYFDDADGPLSQEYVDAGIWPPGSLLQRLTAFAEGRFLGAADALAVLSWLRREEVTPRCRVPVEVLPCAVDTELFTRDAAGRERVRAELGLSGTVLVYSGKDGGWYRTDLLVSFARAAREVFEPLTLLVLTADDPERFARPAAEAGVRCVVRRASRQEMPVYLSAADAGVSFRLEAPSQRACSPIKNGEYLACGLPVLTTPGAGDYSSLVTRERVGLVVDDESSEGLRRAAEQLRRLLLDPGLAARCRSVAVSEVGLSQVVLPRYLRIYEALLGPPEPRKA